MRFPEMCFRVAGFKDSRQGPAQEAVSQPFPGYVLVDDPGLRDLPSSLGKDAEEGGVSSGESQTLLGTILREMDALAWPCPPLGRSMLVLERMDLGS